MLSSAAESPPPLRPGRAHNLHSTKKGKGREQSPPFPFLTLKRYKIRRLSVADLYIQFAMKRLGDLPKHSNSHILRPSLDTRDI